MTLPGASNLAILTYIAIRYLYRGTICMILKTASRTFAADHEVGMNGKAVSVRAAYGTSQ
jgi:hypothetical protein